LVMFYIGDEDNGTHQATWRRQGTRRNSRGKQKILNRTVRIDIEKNRSRKGSATYFGGQILEYNHDDTVSWWGLIMFWGTVWKNKSVILKIAGMLVIMGIVAALNYWRLTDEWWDFKCDCLCNPGFSGRYCEKIKVCTACEIAAAAPANFTCVDDSPCTTCVDGFYIPKGSGICRNCPENADIESCRKSPPYEKDDLSDTCNQRGGCQEKIPELDKLSGYMNLFVSFMMSLFLRKTIERWWDIREQCIGSLMKSILNLCQLASVYLHKRDTEMKFLILRYGLLSHALMYKYAQNTDDDLHDILDLNLITTHEMLLLKDEPRKTQMVWVWIMQIFKKLLWEDEKIPFHLSKNIHDECFRGKEAIRKTFCYLETQFPLPYVHLLALGVHMFHIVLSVVSGINLSFAINYGNRDEVVFNIIKIIIFGVIFQGTLSIARKLQNPLGDHDIDFNRLAYHVSLVKTAEGMFIAGDERPFLEVVE